MLRLNNSKKQTTIATYLFFTFIKNLSENLSKVLTSTYKLKELTEMLIL